MSNFDFLKSDTRFEAFAEIAMSAERTYHIDPAVCALACRSAMEFAVKWMYSVDESLVKPYESKLLSLLTTDEFRDITGKDLFQRLDYIRKIGNNAGHNPKSVSGDQALLALKNLHVFMDFIAYCYGTNYVKTEFIEPETEFLIQQAQPVQISVPEIDIDALIFENKTLKEELTKRRETREESYAGDPLNFTEEKTRKAYIDVMLTDSGWVRGKGWVDEYEIGEMPNKSGYGFADYVLFGDDGRPLAVIEAKKTSFDKSKGRQQAKLYSDFLEKKFGRRPITFLTNGYDTSIIIDQEENGYPERDVSGIYSKRDLEKEFYKLKNRKPLKNIGINEEITNRYYQKQAIQAVCERFDDQNRRKALLVMATGSGKTRTVISIVDAFLQHGWVQKVLFLADRNALVRQAKREFYKLMPDISTANLVENKDCASARVVFSTYQTMMNAIDSSVDDEGKKLFTCGHFDLIVTDEAHRSIYNKYKDIFAYFDSLLIGLTATPKNEIDKNTYRIFDLADGEPTFSYDLKRAVEDKFLVDFISIETDLKFMTKGITYDELSDKDKEEYENTFMDEDGNIPKHINFTALNQWIFNRNTIAQVLNILITKGLKVDYGGKIGKTIIFASSHKHAEKILKVWNEEYPNYPPHFCEVIDNFTNYAQSLIDDFSVASKMPQIAISVDMLDTGIDVPEILNLVFFKRVLSRSKFWQMIGRGTRLCEGLVDGNDKQGFYIFDFCRNFEFFKINGKGKESAHAETLQGRLFNLKAELAYYLRKPEYQENLLPELRSKLVDELLKNVRYLNRSNFAVKQHIRYVDMYGIKKTYDTLTFEDINIMAEHIAPLLQIDENHMETDALRFDELMVKLELFTLSGKNRKKGENDVVRKAKALLNYGTIPDVKEQFDLLNTIVQTDYVYRADIDALEKIRIALRDLMKYIKHDPASQYDTDFKDEEIGSRVNSPRYSEDSFLNYKDKVNYYIRQHQGESMAISKLRHNVRLEAEDINELEKILWSECGTKEDYEKEFHGQALGELVRSIVGLDMTAANEAFNKYLNEAKLDSKQIYFVKQIIDYIVYNGMIKDFAVLQKDPFANAGSVADVFGSDVKLWGDIMKTIETINNNAYFSNETRAYADRSF